MSLSAFSSFLAQQQKGTQGTNEKINFVLCDRSGD
jgi:hypothetical protein